MRWVGSSDVVAVGVVWPRHVTPLLGVGENGEEGQGCTGGDGGGRTGGEGVVITVVDDLEGFVVAIIIVVAV